MGYYKLKWEMGLWCFQVFVHVAYVILQIELGLFKDERKETIELTGKVMDM